MPIECSNWYKMAQNWSYYIWVMGHLIEPNIVHWFDFCHTKNLKFVPPPIIRFCLMDGENWLYTKLRPKIGQTICGSSNPFLINLEL